MNTNTPNEKGTPQSRTYTVNDIAAILGISRATAYKLANSGAFKTIRIGNMIRISRKSFEEWLKMEEKNHRAGRIREALPVPPCSHIPDDFPNI